MTPRTEAEPTSGPTQLTKAAARLARRAEQKQKQAARAPKPLVAKTKTQARYLAHLKEGESVFAVGAAGTGKTYLAARIAARRLIDGEIDKIIVSRVTVSKPKHALGFLPGKVEAKMLPWVQPLIDGLRAEVSAATLETWQQEGKFVIAAFEHMRGRTFDRCMLILDEAQNADHGDLKLFLTRTGEGTQVIVTGDLDQIDIPDSGLTRVIEMVERFNVPAKVIRFSNEDVVRSPLAKAFVKAFAAAANLDKLPRFLDTAPLQQVS